MVEHFVGDVSRSRSGSRCSHICCEELLFGLRHFERGRNVRRARWRYLPDFSEPCLLEARAGGGGHCVRGRCTCTSGRLCAALLREGM